MSSYNKLRNLSRGIFLTGSALLFSGWGFFAHRNINRLAVFTLPQDMIAFYKRNIDYIEAAAVNPDRRRFTVKEEGPRHYIDLDHYGDSAATMMPCYWQDAVIQYSEDTLNAYGVLPWHVNRMYHRLKEAFMVGDPEKVLRISAELGHYLADAHVPLHSTENYDGQLTGQRGIHALWESRLPELFAGQYNFFVGQATYISNPQETVWEAIITAHAAVDSVLMIEKALAMKMEEKKYSFETKGKQTQRVCSREYSRAYHAALNNMVERQMRAAVKTIGSFWYSAWVDAGQPELRSWIDYHPSEEVLKQRREEIKQLQPQTIRTRDHEGNIVE